MKKIFRNLKFGLMLCAGMFAASCSDVDEVMDEIPYTRVLTPLNFEADVVASAGTDVKFTWSTVSNAESYILEVFEAVVTTDTDGEGKEVEIVSAPDYETALPAHTFELSNDDVPYTVRDLEVDKSFYARVRAVSSKVEPSHWAYLADYVTTSAVRASLNPFVIARTASSVTVGWENAEDKDDLTSVRIEPVVPVEGATPVVMALSEAEKSECKVLVENLDACTNYKFTLLFGKSGGRGLVTAWTRPDTEGTTRITSSEAFVQAIKGAAGDLKLLLAYNDGAVYDLTSEMPLNAAEGIYDPYTFGYGLEIYGESTEAGAKPVIRAAFKNTAAASMHFEDVVIEGANKCGVFLVTGASMGDVEFVNCELTGFTKGIYNGAAGFDVESLVYDGVYAHDINNIGANGGDFIDIRGGNYGKIEIKNSTFYACARSFLRISETATSKIGSVAVANCTFNYVTTTLTSSNNSGIFHIRYSPAQTSKTPTELGSFTMSNCVFMNMNSAAESESAWWVRLTRDSNENYAPICAGNIYYNIGHMYEGKNNGQNTFFPTKSVNLNGDAFTAALALADGGLILDEDPCTNSAAGKMYLKNGIIAANKAGDPRWWNASAPVIVRPTELVTVAEPTVWDFTDKTKFDTETVETNQIIENIRIYAPAEIVMNEGVTFASAASVNAQGVPQNSALQFRAQGVGAVEVTTLDGGVNSSVQVVVGTDRYVLLADGETHKVVLGDLVGENDIYVLAGSAVTVTKVAWTDDLTPEATVETLAAPKVSVDKTSFDQGTEEAVTVSWPAVENAASYEVTFQGKKSEVTETSFVIDAATVAALMVGEYEVKVVAKPVPTSSKYAASEAGTASFKVKKVILAGMVTVLWDFNDAGFDTAAAAIGTSDNKEADATYTVGGVDLRMQSLGATMKVEARTEGRRLRTGGGSKVDSRAIWFKMPKATESATLKIYGTNPSSSTNTLTFNAVNADNTANYGTAQQVGSGYQEITLIDGVAFAEGDLVYITCNGGYRYATIELSYADPNAGPVEKELVWNFTDAGFDTIATAINSDGSLSGNQQFEWDGLSFFMGGKTKYGTATINDELLRFIQWGGKGKSGERSCYFTAPGPGTLTVMASNTGSGQDLTRLVTVNVNGVETSQVGGTPSSAPTVVSFDLDDVTAGTKVEIYPSGNGLRFFYVKYTYFE